MGLFNSIGDVAFNLSESDRYVHKAGESWTHVRKYRKDLREEWDRRFEHEHIDKKDTYRLSMFWGEALEQAIREENKSAERYFRSKAEKYHFAEFSDNSTPKREFWETYTGYDFKCVPFEFRAKHGDPDFFEKDKLYKRYVKFGPSYHYNPKTKAMKYAFLGKWGTKNKFNDFVYIWIWRELLYTWGFRVILTLLFNIVAWFFLLPLLLIFDRKYFCKVIRDGWDGTKHLGRILLRKE